MPGWWVLVVALVASCLQLSEGQSGEICRYNCKPEDCASAKTCGVCTTTKDAFQNDTCQSFNDPCPLEETKSDEAVIDQSKCIVYSEEEKFYMVIVALALALLLLVAVGIYYQRKKKTEEEDKEIERLAFQKQKKSKSEKDLLEMNRRLQNQAAAGDHHPERKKANKKRQEKKKEKKHEERDVELYEVLSKGGLRYRDEPDAHGDVLGVKIFGSIIESVGRKGNWLKHSMGWSMMSDGKKNGRRFVRRVEGGASEERNPPWTCGSCTFLNNGNLGYCEQCDTKKMGKHVKPEDVIVLKKGKRHKLGM